MATHNSQLVTYHFAGKDVSRVEIAKASFNTNCAREIKARRHSGINPLPIWTALVIYIVFNMKETQNHSYFVKVSRVSTIICWCYSSVLFWSYDNKQSIHCYCTHSLLFIVLTYSNYTYTRICGDQICLFSWQFL